MYSPHAFCASHCVQTVRNMYSRVIPLSSFVCDVGFLLSVAVDTREVQPHDTGEKEQLGLANVKVEPGSTGATTTSSTGARLLHGILSQHPQQHGGLGLQNGYGRHLAGHAQIGQPPYTTAAIATTSTPGKGPIPFSLPEEGISCRESPM